MAFPVFLGIAVDDGVHLVHRYLSERGDLVRTLAGSGRSVVLTSVTTAVGFLSFLASPLAPVASFGLFAALGILFCLLFTVSALPAALVLLPRDALARPARPGRDSAGAGLLPTTLPPLLADRRRRRWVLTGLAAGFALLAAGAFRLTVEDGWIGAFSPASDLRRSTERIDQLFGGTHLLRLHLDATDAPGERPLADPQLLEAVGRLEAHAATLPGVGRVLGPHVEIETASFVRFARDEEARKIPETAERVERLLDRVDEARGAHRRREWLSDDRREGIVTLFIRDAGFRRVDRIMASVASRAAEELGPHGVTLGFAGDVAVSQAMIRAVVATQLRSLALALLGSFLLLALLERSLARSLLVLAPVTASVAAVLGTMGWAGIPLGVATSMFCAVTLGVGIDGAIHLVSAWRDRAHRPASGRRALEVAGPAIAADAAAIAAGFALLGFSQVAANARLGLLVALALVLSAVATLVGLGAALHARPAE
jgi:predicted RND superfamily exporter protein